MMRAIMISCCAALVWARSVPADEANHKQAAAELLEISRARQLLDQVKASVQDMVRKQMAAVPVPPEAAEMAEQLNKELMAWFSEVFSWDRLRPLYIEIYVAVFSEDEIRELIEFYRSPLGQKLLDRMPELMQKTMEKTQKMLEPTLAELQQRMERSARELEEKFRPK